MAENNLGRGVSKFVADIKNSLTGKHRDKIAEIAAKSAAELIKKRTIAGQGVSKDGGSPRRLKSLSASYIAFRQSQTLSPLTNATMSNLTFTGSMLGSLGAQKIKPGLWKVTITGNNSRTGTPNAQVARYVSRTRPFFFLTGGEIAQIREDARSYFDLVKQKFKR